MVPQDERVLSGKETPRVKAGVSVCGRGVPTSVSALSLDVSGIAACVRDIPRQVRWLPTRVGGRFSPVDSLPAQVSGLPEDARERSSGEIVFPATVRVVRQRLDAFPLNGSGLPAMVSALPVDADGLPRNACSAPAKARGVPAPGKRVASGGWGGSLRVGRIQGCGDQRVAPRRMLYFRLLCRMDLGKGIPPSGDSKPPCPSARPPHFARRYRGTVSFAR